MGGFVFVISVGTNGVYFVRVRSYGVVAGLRGVIFEGPVVYPFIFYVMVTNLAFRGSGTSV